VDPITRTVDGAATEATFHPLSSAEHGTNINMEITNAQIPYRP
jgi:hypothetical protein